MKHNAQRLVATIVTIVQPTATSAMGQDRSSSHAAPGTDEGSKVQVACLCCRRPRGPDQLDSQRFCLDC